MTGRPIGRALLGSLVLWVPVLAVLIALNAIGDLAVAPAAWAALAAYVGILLVAGPLFRGLAYVRAALDALAEGAPALPELRTWSPTARELARAVMRLGRALRETAAGGAAARAGAEAVLAALPDPLLLIDRERRILSANPAATALLGARLQGRDLAGAVRAPSVLAAADAVLKGSGPRIVGVDMPGPVERHLSAQVTPLEPPTSDGAAAVLTLTDLTTLKRSERMRQDFVANASHELRTPLATLVGFIETLRGPARDDAQARERFLSIMADQASRMNRLVDDLLSLSHIELNEHVAPKDQVDLRRVLAAVADSLEQRAEQRQMRVTLAISADLPPVLGDADELTQVFQNLIDNAIKYGRAGTEVAVEAGHSERRLGVGGAVRVAVRDQGEGILIEHLPRLTERFYRVDPARSRELGGTGLGLAIVKHIVNHHRGVLDISSELGQGSVFTVHMPIAENSG
jgi:two-component system, OmpR family, phosphate regulon sensor histidine kinase PhoR